MNWLTKEANEEIRDLPLAIQAIWRVGRGANSVCCFVGCISTIMS